LDIHVVRPGDTLYGIAEEYGVPISQLLDNRLPNPDRLVVGQPVVIQYPEETYAVQAGDTLETIAVKHHTSARQILRNNPSLNGEPTIFPGQSLVLRYRQEQAPSIMVSGHASLTIDQTLFRRTLPYFTTLNPFPYVFGPDGQLISMEDKDMISRAQSMQVAPTLHIASAPGHCGGSSTERTHALLSNPERKRRLIQAIIAQAQARMYHGIELNFEQVAAEDADHFLEFIRALRELAVCCDLPITVVLPPKYTSDMPDHLHAGYHYHELGQVADMLVLMTYQWGCSGSPPMAIAPLDQMQQVVEYAVSQIPSQKLLLGIANNGKDWKLPYQPGQTPRTISNLRAVELAGKHYTAIQYHTRCQAPWFRYVDQEGAEHEVWFEDARSIRAKLALIAQYHLKGVSYWNLMHRFPQNWLVLNAMHEIQTGG